MDALRTCNKCGVEAFTEDDLDLFAIDRFSKHGRRNACKPCEKERNNIYDSNHRKQRLESSLSRYHENTEELNHKRWVYEINRKYGVSESAYYDMAESQSYSCAICGIHQNEQTKKMAVDHCHDTGEVRGLLCQHCNMAIGQFNHDTERLVNAIRYLEIK